jgi:poly(A) polymerase Pap1
VCSLILITVSMAATQAKQWGTTPAISQAFPTDAEIAANDALIAELKAQNNFESVEETEKRCELATHSKLFLD